MVQFYGHFSAKWAKRPQTFYCGNVKDETPFRHSPAGIETQVLEIIMKYSYISQSFNWFKQVWSLLFDKTVLCVLC